MHHCVCILFKMYAYCFIVFLFSVALPCEPTLVAPVNGSIVCTGLQVTDQSCEYFCDPGFSPMGTVDRTCQDDNTWSGENNIVCAPYACDQLTSSGSALLTLPCGRVFPTECTYVCDDGYELPISSSRLQESYCISVVDPVKFVDWTSLEQCVG